MNSTSTGDLHFEEYGYGSDGLNLQPMNLQIKNKKGTYPDRLAMTNGKFHHM